ncbi:uncharacterized protein BJX67DRAFT_368786 [Aspergillus lucknowensis]|uniref:Clr5 domain-containing protein n=1 Tax=Aspergillus lucknowensis TaxID=176173 RepID=A0ABR4L8K0_9EURO
MSSDSNSTGHNKEYYPHEEHILIYFKSWDLSWIQIAEEFNSRVDINRQRTPAALESKWRQLKRYFSLLSHTSAVYPTEEAVPSLNMVWPPSEYINLADPPLSTLRIQYYSNQHPLVDVLMRGLDDAVLVAVLLGFGQVDLAVIASETHRIYGKYKLLSFEHFSGDDPIIQHSNGVGETFDDFRARIGGSIFKHYHRESLRTYSTQTNIPSSQIRNVWAWFASRIGYLRSRLGTCVTNFSLRGIFAPAALPALKCLLLLAEVSSDTSVLEATSPTLIDRRLSAYDKRVDDIISAIAMEMGQDSLAKLAVTTWIFDTSQFPAVSASLFRFLSDLTENAIPIPLIIYRHCREVQNKPYNSQDPRRHIDFLIGLRVNILAIVQSHDLSSVV